MGSTLVMIIVVAVAIVVGICDGGRDISRSRSRGGYVHGFLKDLIQFPSVQPDASTCGTVIDLNSLSFGHH
jgi:hypothetical protein